MRRLTPPQPSLANRAPPRPFDGARPLLRPLAAEAVGTALLLAIIVGSGIMGDRLAGGNVAIALLGNSVATGAGLVVLIHMFGPVSRAHFNPAVTLALALRGDIEPPRAIAYLAAQCLGALLGVWLAHAMFSEPLVQLSTQSRHGLPLALSEAVATFGLIGTILATGPHRPDATPMAVGLYIAAAYWFTASTSFANPAVTLARGLTDSFSGIAPACVPPFILAQLIGTLAAVAFFAWLFDEADDK